MGIDFGIRESTKVIIYSNEIDYAESTDASFMEQMRIIIDAARQHNITLAIAEWSPASATIIEDLKEMKVSVVPFFVSLRSKDDLLRRFRRTGIVNLPDWEFATALAWHGTQLPKVHIQGYA